MRNHTAFCNYFSISQLQRNKDFCKACLGSPFSIFCNLDVPFSNHLQGCVELFIMLYEPPFCQNLEGRDFNITYLTKSFPKVWKSWLSESVIINLFLSCQCKWEWGHHYVLWFAGFFTYDFPRCVFSIFYGLITYYINWASKETYHFFRVTFTEIHCIKMIHIGHILGKFILHKHM